VQKKRKANASRFFYLRGTGVLSRVGVPRSGKRSGLLSENGDVMKIVRIITEAEVVRRILRHL
jgi:hypothetical protein